MDNLEIYNKFRSVPKDALKDFDNGKFKGTDINTMWRIKCLTELFGVVGFGWTFKVVRTWTEDGANDEKLAFAEIEMRIKLNGEWSEPFSATGGNKLVKYSRKGDYYDNSDEAFKMAITDAFGVACKYIGIGADVYWDNDKSKYTEEQNMTLDEAKALKYQGKDKEYTLGELDKEHLLLIKSHTRRTDLLEAVSLILENMNDNNS